MMRKSVALMGIILFAVLLAAAWNGTRPVTSAAEWQAKVDPWVLDTAVEAGETEFLVFLAEQADLSAAASLRTKEEKGRYVYETLTATAEQTQGALRAELDKLGVEFRPFWVANMIWVRGSLDVVQTLALREDVAHIYANPTVKADIPQANPAGLSPEAVEWNIALVNAPAVWAEGVTGEGAVIGGQDTGYDWDHPGLKEMYRGWNGTTADHNYSWHDAIHSGGGICGPNSPEPCDDNGHGTHTMGTMVGDDGGVNQVGMAPGAKWIGCRNMNVGDGTPATYSECYEWFIAPTDLNGENPDPTKAPHVINNSWGCPAIEGCTDPNILLTVVQNVRAAGIVTVHSAGNAGPGCSTVNTPSAIYDESFSVGSTTSSDTISGFSSRGPVTVDGSGRLKPDISAPGSGIRSTIPGGGYGNSSGTSMAGPHVAGLVALLISADPSLAGQVDEIEQIIQDSAVQLTTAQECGGVPGDQIPNNTFGYGRIDALAAYNMLGEQPEPHELVITKTAAAEVVAGELLTYTLTLTHEHPVSATMNVVVWDEIPAGTTFVTATLPHTYDGTTVTWNEPTLDPGESLTVQLVVEVTAAPGETISNDTYGASSDDVLAVNGDPVLTEVIEGNIPLLTISKTASAGEVLSGDWITYTLTLTNNDPVVSVANIEIWDTVPAGAAFISATLPHTYDGTTVTWSAAGLGPGESLVVELVVGVLAEPGATISNEDYGGLAVGVPAVTGEPVLTAVVNESFLPHYLPLIYKGGE